MKIRRAQIWFVLGLGCAAGLSARHASATVEITALGAMSFVKLSQGSDPNVSGSVSGESKIGFGGEFYLGGATFGPELGVLIASSRDSATSVTGNQSLIKTIPWMDLNAGLRLRLGRLLAFSAGASYAVITGDITVANGTTGASTTSSASALSLKTWSLAAYGGVWINLPLEAALNLTLGGRYYLLGRDQDDGSGNSYTEARRGGLMFFAGLGFVL